MSIQRSKVVKSMSVAAAILLVLSFACNQSEPTATTMPPTTAPLQIVTTSNIVGEWVRIVGGDRVEVMDLVPRGVDPHSFQPGARDIARVADAETVFAVGLSLEREWLEDLVDNAAADHELVIEIGERIDPIEFSFESDDHGEEDEGDDHGEEDEGEEEEDGEHHEEDEDEDAEEAEHHGEADEDEDEIHDEDEVKQHHEDDGHGHGALDPHFWFDPQRVIVAVRQIAEELRTIDPDSADYYNANRDSYVFELEELDEWIIERVSEIDEHDRLLVTTHDSLGYFANRYGFTVAGVIIPGGSTELERSPQELAQLVEEVEEQGARVVFAEEQLSDRLANTLAREAGIEFVGGLYVGSLGDDGSGVSTYVDMMRNTVDIIVEALEE